MVFGRKNLSPLEKIRKSKAGLFQRVVEKKIEELNKNGESGPRAHLRYLALKDLCRDRDVMKEFIFTNGLYFTNNVDIENLANLKEVERAAGEKNIENWERSLNNTMEAFSKLIERKVSELRARGSIDDGVACGLEFLALEELFEENEIADKNIKKEDWKKAGYANCTVACIEDLESRIQVDRALRKELGQKAGSYEYKTCPKLNLFLDVLNRVYEQKRKSLLAQGQKEQLREFGIQEAYKVNIERIIYNYKKAQNFMVVYHPRNQALGHALKVLDIENDIVIAQDLYTGLDKSDIRKHRIADLVSEGDEIFVVMDDDVLTEEELSTIILSTEEIPTVEKIVTLSDFLENWIYFKIKIEKLRERCQIFLLESESLDLAMVLCDFKDGAYQYTFSFNKLIHDYIYKNAQRSVLLSKFTEGSDEIIVGVPPSLKEKYFKEERGLTKEERKGIKMVIGEVV